ncbi:nitrate- and nitrite sensing domain-containing protein [Actinomadura sp. 9N215]|uniref:nitrate- and nitrite sensing domain-containing protein n=1 Tax=Actinomadura sp. 9N215 TaxID=3375150 RepID=UPI0037A7A5FE
MTALWVFAAWVTLRDGLNLLGVSALDTALAQPSDPLLSDLQRERRLSMVFMARPSATSRSALDAQRTQTNKTRTEAIRLAEGANVGRFGSDTLERRVDDMLERLKTVDATRRRVDTGAGDRDRVASAYTEINDAIFQVYDSLATLDDQDFARDTRTLIALNRSWELLSREDALMAGSLASGRITQADLVAFTQTVGARRLDTEQALASVQESDAGLFQGLTENAGLNRVEALENQIMHSRPAVGTTASTTANTTAKQARAAARPPVTAEQWDAAAAPALADMREQIQGAGDRLVDRATPIATGVIIRLLLAGGLGLLAVIASVVVSITTARALVRQLERLRRAAWELAEQRLPGVVERLGHGEKVDVAVEAPPLEFGSDEIGQVGHAFNAVQETAIRTAVEQAELRRGIRDVLLSLARRTQTLVHRQLTMLDTMERRRDIEVKELEELFRLDHLATRMRRNAENLIVLSGALPARGWRNSVPMVDVVRAAVGEVEDYTRVTVLPFGPVELAGRAVGDLTHLLAELIENAVSFSPPETVVQVGGHLVASGFAIDIEDRGLGMTDEKLTEINARIADPPDFNLQSSVQLGLFVVSRLAERYNLQVSLKRSAYGGTTAVIVIPRELIVEQSPAPTSLAATTTQNGLEVRQPTAVGASVGGRSGASASLPSGSASPSSAAALPAATPPTSPTSPTSSNTGPQPAGPSLVAVPPPGDGAVGGHTAPTEPGAPAEPGGPDESETEPPAGHGVRPGSDGPAPGDGGHPATHEPEDRSPVPDISITPSGLPVRVPQANLAEPLRTDEPVVDEGPEDEDPGRSPEEIQRIMGSYQRGTRQGRSDAAQSDESGLDESSADGSGADEGGADESGPDESGPDRRGTPLGTNAAEGEEDQ